MTDREGGNPETSLEIEGTMKMGAFMLYERLLKCSILLMAQSFISNKRNHHWQTGEI
jgi:hypothetical protein